MSMLKRIMCVFITVCLAFTLTINAAALTPRIDSISKTADNQYKVEGSIEGYDASTSGQLYASTYNVNGQMTGVNSVTPDANGNWSYTGGKSSTGQDVVKTFIVDKSSGKFVPQGINDKAVTVKTMDQFAAALSDGTCDNIFIADNISLSASADEKTVTVNKTVTISEGITLSVPTGYTLQINSGACLTIAGGGILNIAGGTLTNSGTIVISNNNGNLGCLRIDSKSTLENDGDIEVYGYLQFIDSSTTAITGNENIHYYANFYDVSKQLYSVISSGYGFKTTSSVIYASKYENWANIDDAGKAAIAFVLDNMTDTSFLEKADGSSKYFDAFSCLTYGEIKQVLAQLWAVKYSGTAMPDSVGADGKTAGDLISTNNYGKGSELDSCVYSFTRALGYIEVADAATFTVNSSDDQQNICYKTFKEAVTVVWDRASECSTQNILFVGCKFEKGLVIVNSGKRFWVNMADCELGTVSGKSCNIFAQPECDTSDKPVFDITNDESEVIVNFYGTTNNAIVEADQTSVHLASYIAGGNFTLNGAQYIGAANLGSSGYFEGRYSIYAYNGSLAYWYGAGQHTVKVVSSGNTIYNFHMWDNICSNVNLQLNDALPSGGYLGLNDDSTDDQYGIVVTGAVGDVTNGNTLNAYLTGNIDISGVTLHNAVVSPSENTAIRFLSGGAWVSPAIVGNYSTAAIDVGRGDLTQDYAIKLYKNTYDSSGNKTRAQLTNVRVVYDTSANDTTYVYGLPDTDDLELEVTCNGKTVVWTHIYRKIDDAACAQFAQALYDRFGSNTKFAYNSTVSGTNHVSDAYGFVTKNGLMTDVTDAYVTRFEAVGALAKIADILDISFNDYFTDNDLTNVVNQDGITYSSDYETALLGMASAFALGGDFIPYYADNGNGRQVLTVGFSGNSGIGKTIIDKSGNTEMSAMLDAFTAACGGSIFVGYGPNILGATFEGPVSMTMGSNQWSNVNFDSCIFKDKAVAGEKLTLLTDYGANVNFNNCTFSSAASGFAVNLEPVTAGQYNDNDENVNLNNLPSGTVINSTYIRFNAGCQASEGTLKINGATITGLDFSNIDGKGTAFNNRFFAAGIWFDDYGNGIKAPTLGFSGAVARVDVPASCATKFGAFNDGDDCPYNVTLNIDGGWTPNYASGLSLRNHSAHTLKLTGSVTGGTGSDESNPAYTSLDLSLTGIVDITGAAISGNYFMLTGYWSDVDQNLSLGDKNISVIYDKSNDENKNFALNIGNTSGSLSSGGVAYYSQGAEKNVTINGFSGIAMTADNKISLGSILTGMYSNGTFGNYALSLYKYNDVSQTWVALTYTVDTAVSGDYTLVPDASLSVPFGVLLSVKYTDPNPADGDSSCTFNVKWFYSAGASDECNVNSADELTAALNNSSINTIHILSDISLGMTGGQQTTYTFGKRVEIAAGKTLTIADNVTLAINDGLVVNGNLVVAGVVQIYGWIDDRGDWDAHISETGTGKVNFYTDLQTFAIELYNRYSSDYGLSNTAVHSAYKDCYASDFYSNSDTAAGITAINFLIENGVISPSATNLNGWAKLPYSAMIGMLGGMANAIETSASLAYQITGYAVNGLADTDLVCDTDNNSDFNTLLNSFADKVGTVDVAFDATYAPGLNNNRFSLNKNYDLDVTINCTDGQYDFFLFSNCTFNGDLYINGGTGADADEIRLLNCSVKGNIIVKDNDGKTKVYFDGSSTMASNATVTVTAKNAEDVPDSARLGASCDSSYLFYLPSDICVINDTVSTAVILSKAGTISINGVVVTADGFPQSGGYAAASTCWQRIDNVGDLPVLVVSGSTTKIDATNDAYNYQKFWMYENYENGLYASNTLLIPKAGSEINIANADDARFKVSFDGTTVIDPIIYNISGTAGYFIDVPDNSSFTYEATVGDNHVSLTPSNGRFTLDTSTDYTKVSLAIIKTDGNEHTIVGIDSLANKVSATALMYANALFNTFATAEYGLGGAYSTDYSAAYTNWGNQNLNILAFLKDNGLTIGSDISPYTVVTRGQIAQWMYDLLGKGSIPATLAQKSTVTFSDVSTANANYAAITCMTQAGVLNGMSDGCFYPDDSFNPKYLNLVIKRFTDLL